MSVAFFPLQVLASHTYQGIHVLNCENWAFKAHRGDYVVELITQRCFGAPVACVPLGLTSAVATVGY